MKTIYVVTAGDYSDYRIIQIFDDLKDAERFCAIENSKEYGDTCNIEFWELTKSGTFQNVECHKAIHCRFSRDRDSGCIWCVSWHMDFSKEPIPFSVECISQYGIAQSTQRWELIIPTKHTYDKENEKDDATIDKIAKDSYYIYRAMEEGIC